MDTVLSALKDVALKQCLLNRSMSGSLHCTNKSFLDFLAEEPSFVIL